MEKHFEEIGPSYALDDTPATKRAMQQLQEVVRNQQAQLYKLQGTLESYDRRILHTEDYVQTLPTDVRKLTDNVHKLTEDVGKMKGGFATAASAFWSATGRQDPFDTIQEQELMMNELRGVISRLEGILRHERTVISELEGDLRHECKLRKTAEKECSDAHDELRKLKEDTEVLGTQLATLENAEAPICCICEEAPVEMCFTFCGHAISCEACTWKLPFNPLSNEERGYACPQCRKKHHRFDIVKLYFP